MNNGLGSASGRKSWLVLPLVVGAVLLAAGFSDRAGFRPIDWQNYLLAAAAFSAVRLWTRFGNFPAAPRSRVILSALTAASPVAFYVYVTGQITALAELALIVLAVLVGSSEQPRGCRSPKARPYSPQFRSRPCCSCR